MSKESYRRRVSPKLRMIANGSETVNTIRAEFAPSVRVATKAKVLALSQVRALTAETVARSDLPASVKRGSLKEPPSTVEASVCGELEDGGVFWRRHFARWPDQLRRVACRPLDMTNSLREGVWMRDSCRPRRGLRQSRSPVVIYRPALLALPLTVCLLFLVSGCSTILGTAASPVTGGVDLAAKATDNNLLLTVPGFAAGAVAAPFVAIYNGAAHDARIFYSWDYYWRHFPDVFRPYRMIADEFHPGARRRRERELADDGSGDSE